jgi:antitoxin ParD1/3/4
MPTIEKLSIALPTEMANLVRQAVHAGEYSSQSEVVRDALRDWTQKRNLRAQGPRTAHTLADLRQLWLEAVADDSDGLDPRPILEALERKYLALAEATAR